MQQTKRTQNMFLTRALERIVADKELRKSHNAQLKKVCQSTLEKTKQDGANDNPGDGPPETSYSQVEIDQYFHVFEMACKSKSPSIVTTSLDCLQKMIVYGMLVGRIPDPSSSIKKPLLDRVVECICNCFNGIQTDEHVQLQIIKVLLTAVTSNNCEIHDGSLLLSVRTCYNIHLASKNTVNQTTARATLTQMLNVIFARMEAQAEYDEQLAMKLREEIKERDEIAIEKKQNGINHQQSDSEQKGKPVNEDPESDQHVTQERNVIGHTRIPHSVEFNVAAEIAENPATESEDGYLEGHKDHLAVNGASEDEISDYHSAIEASSDDRDVVVKELLFSILDQVSATVVFNHSMTQHNDATFVGETSRTASIGSASDIIKASTEILQKNTKFSHILQKDAFLVFRSFCKLSMTLITDGPHDPKSPELRSKILSLQLLLTILESAGPLFKTNDMFVNAVKQYLCVALSKNGVSSEVEVFRISLEIFVKLLENFKTHLKIQIQVFFKEIFLNIMESSSASYQHKWIVLDMALKICSDAQLLVDIYVNYDCDINAVNIFYDLASLLAKIAQTSNSNVGFTPTQDQWLRKKSLECIVAIVRCMKLWSQELYINPQHMSNLGKEHLLETGLPGNFSMASSSNLGSHMSLHSNSSDPHQSYNSIAGAADNPEALEVVKQQKDILEQGIDLFVGLSLPNPKFSSTTARVLDLLRSSELCAMLAAVLSKTRVLNLTKGQGTYSQTFNRKPNKGIAYLQTQGMIGGLPTEVAEFLLTETRLNPSEVGDYLGENEKMNKEAMYAYVDLFDFVGLDFVSSLRRFLESFRLPGEAQKIDRLMEKFASRYCDCNPHGTVFASADAAYVLAYSIIMLTTDLHSIQVKRKMTKEDYIRMNRGINESRDLPKEYLEDIYNQIKKREIALKATRGTVKVAPVKGIVSGAQRMREMQEMASTAKALMEAASHVQSEFISTSHCEHVRPMFKSCWRSVLVALSMGLQDFDEKPVTTMCLEGLKYAVRVACIFGLSLERDTFIQALSRFSLLQATAGIRELKWKNIESIKTLISIAYTDGNYLQESWHEILKCISHLELLQLIGSGVKDQSTTAMKKSAVLLDNNPILTKTFGMEQRKLATIQESMGEMSSQNIVVAVDRIFTGSTRLDGDAIVDFVQWLCKVSSNELNNHSHPRKFSLQKLVEISYYNMGRIRIQWSRIWAILGEHFNAVGCSDDEGVAFFAVDSLRQLSMKFLEKGELPGFSFQKDFLRPFEHIMKRNPSLMIQDMVVRCIAQMVTTQSPNIKSGWKNIFSVFTIAASHTDEAIVELAFVTTSNIITEIFQFYFSSIIYCFQDAISALGEFSCSSFPDTSMEAIRLIRLCADYVAMKPELFEDLIGDELQSPAAPGERVWVRGWFPVLFELSCIVSRCNLDVRTRGLTVMFEIMKTHGQSFRINWWSDLFHIVFRIFDQIKAQELHVEKSDWFSTTCNHALFAVCDVFTQYYDVLAPSLLADIYNQLLWCVEKDNEQLARSGVNCLENLILSNGKKFTPEIWQLSCETMQRVFILISPAGLLSWNPNDPDSGKLFHLQLCCVITIELVEAVDRILFYPNASKMDNELNINMTMDPAAPLHHEYLHQDELFPSLSVEQLLIMIRCLHDAHDMAKRFNSNEKQRLLLWKAGFKGKSKSKPHLVKLEISSLSCVLRTLFRLGVRKDIDEKIHTFLQRTCRIALAYFCSIQVEAHRRAWTPVLLVMLTRLLRCDDKIFSFLSPDLHDLMCDLLIHDIEPVVRHLLRRYLLRHNAVLSAR